MLKSLAIASVLLLGGCSTPDDHVETAMTQSVADLPYSQGLSFATLDEYLAHLHRLSAQDRPYFEEVAPDRYRRVTGRRAPGSVPDERIYTREELLELYGFAE